MSWLYQPLLPASADIQAVSILPTAYWVGGTGTWNAVNSDNWAATSGGTGGAGYPDSSSTVIFDSNSGTGTVTINGGVCNDFNISSGVSAITLSPSSVGLTIYGNATISSTDATISGSGPIIFAATTSKNITSGGDTFNCPIWFNGIGGEWVLQDSLTVDSSRTTTLTNGTLNLNDQNLITGYFSSSNSNTRAIYFGSGNITLNGDGDVFWDVGDTTNLTVTGTTRTVNISSTTVATSSIQQGNLSESESISFSFTSGSYDITLNTSNVYNLDFTGFAGNLVGWSICTVYGSLTFSAEMTVSSADSGITFAATSGTKTITSNGKILNHDLLFNGAGGTWQLQDDLTVNWEYFFELTIVLINGTLDLNGTTFIAGNVFNTDEGIKNITFNGGTLACRTFTNNFSTDFSTTAGVGTGKISMIGDVFEGGNATYNCTLENSGSGTLTISGGNTFNDITNSVSPATFNFPAGYITTVNNFNVSGTPENIVTINSTDPGFTQFILYKASGTVNVSYCTISDSDATGGASWQASTTNGNTDGGNNTGWIFVPLEVFLTMDTNLVLSGGILITF